MNTNRKSDHRVLPLILHRWSPRSFTSETISQEQLFSLLEAARWAPSAFNNQPWRFVYAMRDTPEWNMLFNVLDDGNKRWAQNAAVLMVIISQTHTNEGKAILTHSFDTGAAWQNIALQAEHMGLAAHGMQGFDYQRARTDLHVPEGYTVEAMCAVGKPAPKELLPADLKKREVPSGRNQIEVFAFKGTFIGK